jgi:hypothetical protein
MINSLTEQKNGHNELNTFSKVTDPLNDTI